MGAVVLTARKREFVKEAWTVHGKWGQMSGCTRAGYRLEGTKTEYGTVFLRTVLL